MTNDDADEAAADLLQALTNLSGLLTSSQSLEATLTKIAEFAVEAIPHADGAGITLLESDRPDTVVASAPFVREVDDIQYGLGEGPCITAVAIRRTQCSGSLGGAALWPRFGPRAGRLGVHSVLSLPLLLADRAVGALNVYARGRDAFDEPAVRIGELFAVPAAVSIFNAQVLAQSQRLAAQLAQALTSRAVVDQALGIVMSRSGATAEEAFDRLKAISQREKVKLVAVARTLIDDAVRRARHRAGGPAAEPAGRLGG